MDPQPNPQSTPQTPVAPASATALERIPSSWPGAFGIYKYAKQAVKPNVGVLIGAYALFAVLSLIVEALLSSDGTGYELLKNLISGVFSAYLYGTAVSLWLAGIKGQKLSFSEAMNNGLAHFLNLFILGIIVYLSIVVSFLLLIVPVFFVLPRLVLSPYYVVDKNLGPLDAYKASWRDTKGHAGKVWGILGVNILIALLMVTIIGIPFALYFYVMYSAAGALLYSYIQQHPATAAPSAVQSAPLPTPAPKNDTPPTPPVSTPPVV